ncbi:hypothetical protein D3C87_1909220 [compost metagenome]
MQMRSRITGGELDRAVDFYFLVTIHQSHWCGLQAAREKVLNENMITLQIRWRSWHAVFFEVRRGGAGDYLDAA